PYEDLKPYDLIHLFNTIRIGDTYNFYRRSKAFKKKIVLTPIYWNYGIYLYRNYQNLKYKYRWGMDNMLRKEVMQNVNLILPSSKAELDIIEKNFRIQKTYKIVYNGVDSCFSDGEAEGFLNKYNIKDDN